MKTISVQAIRINFMGQFTSLRPKANLRYFLSLFLCFIDVLLSLAVGEFKKERIFMNLQRIYDDNQGKK